MKPDSKMSIAGQWLTGLLFGAIALYCGWISLMMNIRFGLQYSETTAQIFAASDAAKILLPIMAAYIGWTTRKRIAWLFAIGISVTAALASLLQDQAQVMKDSQATSRVLSNAEADATRIRGELAGISEKRSPAAIKAEIAAHKQHKRWTSTIQCTDATVPESYEYCQAYNRLHADLATAGRRDELLAQLDTATASITATPEKANGPSDHLATLTGGDKIMIASVFSTFVSIAQLVILEFLATFSGDAGATIRNAINAMRRNRPAKRPLPIATPVQQVATAAPKRATKAYYLERLAKESPHFAEKVQRGEMSVYAACIATGLRKPPKGDWTKPVAYGLNEKAKA
jgi:hypothetical protein